MNKCIEEKEEREIDRKERKNLNKLLPSGSFAITVELRSTPPLTPSIRLIGD